MQQLRVPGCHHSCTPLSLPRSRPVGCGLGGPCRAEAHAARPRDTHSLAETLPSLSSKGAKPTHLAQLCLPFLPQQKGWLPPFKGRLSRGISPDAAGIRKGSAPHRGPTGPAGTFRGSGAFISSVLWARPLPLCPRAPGQELPATGMGGRSQRAPILGCDRTPDSCGVERSLLKVTELHRPRA